MALHCEGSSCAAIGAHSELSGRIGTLNVRPAHLLLATSRRPTAAIRRYAREMSVSSGIDRPSSSDTAYIDVGQQFLSPCVSSGFDRAPRAHRSVPDGERRGNVWFLQRY